MADRDARPEFNPKYRIVGAIVLVAFAVIFLPMILSESEPPPEPRGVTETSRRAGVAETRVVVTPVAGNEAKSEPAPKTDATASTAEKPATENAPPEAGAVSVEKPAPVKKPETATPPEKIAKVAATEKVTKGWMVQVGIFSHLENAARLRDKLRSHGQTVHAETVTLEGKRAMRLRVGPFQDRAQAARAQAQIHKETGVQGAVQAYP